MLMRTPTRPTDTRIYCNASILVYRHEQSDSFQVGYYHSACLPENGAIVSRRILAIFMDEINDAQKYPQSLFKSRKDGEDSLRHRPRSPKSWIQPPVRGATL